MDIEWEGSGDVVGENGVGVAKGDGHPVSARCTGSAGAERSHGRRGGCLLGSQSTPDSLSDLAIYQTLDTLLTERVNAQLCPLALPGFVGTESVQVEVLSSANADR